jgi:hypothetical protein
LYFLASDSKPTPADARWIDFIAKLPELVKGPQRSPCSLWGLPPLVPSRTLASSCYLIPPAELRRQGDR